MAVVAAHHHHVLASILYDRNRTEKWTDTVRISPNSHTPNNVWMTERAACIRRVQCTFRFAIVLVFVFFVSASQSNPAQRHTWASSPSGYQTEWGDDSEFRVWTQL